jgi:hypothetical protein
VFDFTLLGDALWDILDLQLNAEQAGRPGAAHSALPGQGEG